MSKKGSALIIILFIVVVILVLAGIWYYQYNSTQSASAPQAAQSSLLSTTTVATTSAEQSTSASAPPSAPAVASPATDSRDAKRIADLYVVQNALELYYNQCGFFPGTSKCSAKTMPASWSALNGALVSEWSSYPAPNDPLGGSATYVYGVNAAHDHYILETTLENPSSAVFENYSASKFSALIHTMTWTSATAPTCAVPQYCVML